VSAEFERVTAYLQALPRGLRSYPDFQVKASLFRFALAARPVKGNLDGLPPQLAKVLREPPLASDWLSEVEYCAGTLAIADLYAMNETMFKVFWYDVMKLVNTGKIYGFLVSMLTPEQLLSGMAMRWGVFHRGVRCDAKASPEGMEVTLTYPPGLLDPLSIKGYVAVFQSVVDVSRHPQSRVTFLGATPTSARYRLAIRS